MRQVTLTRDRIHAGPLILVNPAHPLQGEVPDLVAAHERWPEILLERRAARLLGACIQAIGGEAAIVPVSGWRSQREQQTIWDETWEREGEAFTRRYVALPGCSEHQTGLAIDLGKAAPEIDFIRPDFPMDGLCGAFRRCAARYGFIQRYRREKEALTGIAEEPWHFRYVGAPHAALLEENGLCLEEYRDFIAQRPRLCRLEGGRTARVSYVPCPGQTVELTLPEGCCQISGDNQEGFFLTVWGNVA